MTTKLDITRPVRFKQPTPDEDGLVFLVRNYNENMHSCYIEVQNLPGWGNSLLPQSLVSVSDLENVEPESSLRKCRHLSDFIHEIFIIVNEDESHYEIVSECDYDWFKVNELRYSRKEFAKWRNKTEFEILERDGHG